MSSAAINPKGPRALAPAATPSAWAQTYLTSTVGQKLLVALTGVLLVGFLVFHMAGNLKMFSGPEAMNDYAHFLKHAVGVWLWVARAGLLLLFVLHLVLALRLRWKAKAARPVGYRVMRHSQPLPAAKSMVWTGVVILLFTVYHLAHYTFGLVHPATAADAPPDGYLADRVHHHQHAHNLTTDTPVNYLDLRDDAGRHDVYAMVLAGFGTPYISAIYLVCQVLLFVHLSHGIQASLQTLGLVGKRFTPVARLIGWGTAGTIFAGNVLIVAAVWAGWVR